MWGVWVTVRDLTPDELERLVRTNRQQRISLLVTVSVLVALLVLLIVNDIDFPAGLGGPLGIGIGLLLLIPQRRVLSELGLSAAEGRAILQAERLRRSGVSALPPGVRADRETLRGRVWLAVGLASIVVLVVSARYFFAKAGQTVEEDAPTDIWFGISFFAGFAALCFAPGALYQAKKHRESARGFQAQAAEATD